MRPPPLLHVPVSGDSPHTTKICSPIHITGQQNHVHLDAVPRIHVASCTDSFASLAEALGHAADHDVVRLAPGVYSESEVLRIDRVGIVVKLDRDSPGFEDGPGQTATIEMKGGHECSVICSAKGVHVSGIQFRSLRARDVECVTEGGPTVPVTVCLVVEAGDVIVEDCSFSNKTGYGLKVTGSAAPTFKSCTFTSCCEAGAWFGGMSKATFTRNIVRKNHGFGLVVSEHASGDFSDNNILENRRCAVMCGGDSTPCLDMNNISDGQQGGVWVQDRSKCVLRHNRLFNNRKAALQVSANSDPMVIGNKFFDGKGGGLVVHEQAMGTFLRNSMSNNQHAGVGIMDEARPIFVGNVITGNRSGGIVLAGKCGPVFFDDVISGNSFAAVGVKEHAKPLFQRVVIKGNQGYGVLMQGYATGFFDESTIEDNQKSGVCLTGHAEMRMDFSSIGSGGNTSLQKVGLTMYDNTRLHLSESKLLDHKGGNLVMRDKSEGSLWSNTLLDAEGAGLVVQGQSSVVLYGNVLRDCKVSNAVFLDCSQVVARGNTFSNSRGAGMILMDSCTASVAHNSILSNGECGLRCVGQASLQAYCNRIAHGQYWGVSLEESCQAYLDTNLIHGNGSAALHLSATSECHVSHNTFLKGPSDCQAIEAIGDVRGLFEENAVQGWDAMSEGATPPENMDVISTINVTDEGAWGCRLRFLLVPCERGARVR